MRWSKRQGSPQGRRNGGLKLQNALGCFALFAVALSATQSEAMIMSEDDIERSKSGSPIYRHDEPKDWDGKLPASTNMEAVDAHIEKYLGPIEFVWHELASDKIHLDIHVLSETDTRPFKVLVTSGVSDIPMTIPNGAEVYDRVELMMALPPDWPLSKEAFENESNYWPIRWLKYIGSLPHNHDTWIGWGHTIPNGDPPENFPDTKFVGVVLHPPYWADDDFFTMKTENGDTVAFYQLVPLYAEEMQFKLDKGNDALEDLFEKKNIDFILDPTRKNVATSNRNPFSRFFE